MIKEFSSENFCAAVLDLFGFDKMTETEKKEFLVFINTYIDSFRKENVL